MVVMCHDQKKKKKKMSPLSQPIPIQVCPGANLAVYQLVQLVEKMGVLTREHCYLGYCWEEMPGGICRVTWQDSETREGGKKLLEDCLVRYWSQLVLLVEVIVRRGEEKVERREEEEEV